MKHKYNCLIAFAVIMLASMGGMHAQALKPVTWSVKALKITRNNYELVFTAKIENGWFTFPQAIQQSPGGDGPFATEFTFTPSSSYMLLGRVLEKSKPNIVNDKGFGISRLKCFYGEAIFSQKIRLLGEVKNIQASVTYGNCCESYCLVPENASFSIEVTYEGGPGSSPAGPANSRKPDNGYGLVKPDEPVGRPKKVADKTFKTDKTFYERDGTPIKYISFNDELKPINCIWEYLYCDKFKNMHLESLHLVSICPPAENNLPLV